MKNRAAKALRATEALRITKAIIAVALMVNLSGCMTTAVVSGAVLSPISWLFGDDNSNEKMRERFDDYSGLADEKWREYAGNLIDDYSRNYDEVSSNADEFGIDKSDLFSIMAVNKLKNNPKIKVENMKFSASEIRSFLERYIIYETETGSREETRYYTTTDADGNSVSKSYTVTITTADITFVRNENICLDLGFTNAEKDLVKSTKEILADILK